MRERERQRERESVSVCVGKRFETILQKKGGRWT